MEEVVIVEGVRTPFVKSGTDLARATVVDLGRWVVGEVLYRAELDPASVDEVVVGNIAQPVDSANVARVIALAAGVPEKVPAVTVCRNCASGFEAITQAADRIRTGAAEIVVAAGVESMSNIPLLFPDEFKGVMERLYRARSLWRKLGALLSLRPRHFKPVVALLAGLTDPVCGLNMGQTAEALSREFGISRTEQDAYALESHVRAARARAEGLFAEEIVPVYPPPRHDRAVSLDNGIREHQSMEALERLQPIFDRRYGTVTAGNACQLTDGGAALLMMSQSRARSLGFEPLATLRAGAYAGLQPGRMGLGPVFAAAKVLEKAGMEMEDVQRIEVNEAFAAQVLACRVAAASLSFCREELGRTRPLGDFSPDKTNVLGGAICLGHPVGASGARIALSLVRQMARDGLSTGMAALCVGGGQGGALVFERN